MSNLKFNIDSAGLSEAFKELATEVEQEINKAAGELAAITYNKTVELANKELNSTLQKYKDALSWEKVDEGIWVVALEQGALFIEEGLPDNFDMKPGLLKNSKVSENGKRYKIVKFDHTSSPKNQNQTARNIVQDLKANLRQQNVPFKKIEKDSKGSPRIGLLHEFDFGGMKKPTWSRGALDSVRIYQKTDDQGKTSRGIFTFRTVSQDQAGKWIHPGIAPKQFMDKALEDSVKIWEEQILPEILKKWG